MYAIRSYYALDRAQDEGNVSRANVVRKVREVTSGAEAQASKWALVAAQAIVQMFHVGAAWVEEVCALAMALAVSYNFV